MLTLFNKRNSLHNGSTTNVPGKRIESTEKGNANKSEKLEKIEEGKAIVKENVCGPCKNDDITTRANGICKDCEEHMCEPCFRSHLRVKSCRHHVFADANQASLASPMIDKGDLKCKQHKAETVKFFCRKHEVVGCGDCMVLEHNACKSEYIKNLSKDFHQSEEFKTLKTTIERLTFDNRTIEKTVENRKKDNMLMLQKALEDIRDFRTDINKYLDKLEADFISEAKDIMSDNDKLLIELEQDCRQLSYKIENINKMLDTEINKDKMLFINTVVCKPNVSDTERAIAELTSKHMKAFEFVYDDDNPSSMLGTLNISSTAICEQTTQPPQTHSGNKETAKNDNTDKKNEEEKSAITEVAVGARVRYNGRLWIWGESNGSVTAVLPGGKVNVKWDGGKTDGPYTVGTGGDVTLI